MSEVNVVLIAGASKGIGFESAILLSKAGYRVIATVRELKDTKALYKAMDGLKTRFDVEKLDVRDERSVYALIEIIRTRYGKIDVLINTIGYGFAGSVEDTSLPEAETLFDINFFGNHRLVRSVLPYMRINTSGLIILFSGGLGQEGLPMLGFYGASKFALEGYAESLSKEIKPFGIQVVLIDPPKKSSTFSKKIEIAIQSMSEHSAYYPQTLKQIRELKKLTEEDQSPIETAQLIQQIIENPKPKFRYQVE